MGCKIINFFHLVMTAKQLVSLWFDVLGLVLWRANIPIINGDINGNKLSLQMAHQVVHYDLHPSLGVGDRRCSHFIFCIKFLPLLLCPHI